MLEIGNVKLKNNLVLAPMAGVNCTAFRVLCKEYGAGLVYTQLYDSDGVVSMYNSDRQKFERMLNIAEEERPISIQLVGSNSETMGQAAKILSNYADIIDINLGCPEKDVLAKQAGAFFSKHPEQLKKIVKPVIENSKVPVTAKIRIGWDDKSITVLDSIKILEELGVKAVAIHARTRKQVYSGKADWEWIKKAKENAKIPIIGNGDLFKPGDAKAMIERTKCDFVMFGRGAMGNPFIFDRTDYLLKNGKNKEEVSSAERKKAFLRFVELYKKYTHKEEVSEFKQHALWFVNTIQGSRKMRDKIGTLENFDDIVKFVVKAFS